MGLYTEPKNMWHNKLSSEKTWDDFKKFFGEEYHDIRELQKINTIQARFHGDNTAITIK